MNQKHERIAAVLENLAGHGPQAHYLGFFDCFNRQLFFEAHEVLEVLWLRERGLAQDHFYKGLIQLAGAFVHLQKSRVQPAAALLKLARTNLSEYPAVHQKLDLRRVRELIEGWLERVQTTTHPEPLSPTQAPKLDLSG